MWSSPSLQTIVIFVSVIILMFFFNKPWNVKKAELTDKLSLNVSNKI